MQSVAITSQTKEETHMEEATKKRYDEIIRQLKEWDAEQQELKSQFWKQKPKEIIKQLWNYFWKKKSPEEHLLKFGFKF